jgi:hypothetical protein
MEITTLKINKYLRDSLKKIKEDEETLSGVVERLYNYFISNKEEEKEKKRKKITEEITLRVKNEMTEEITLRVKNEIWDDLINIIQPNLKSPEYKKQDEKKELSEDVRGNEKEPLGPDSETQRIPENDLFKIPRPATRNEPQEIQEGLRIPPEEYEGTY